MFRRLWQSTMISFARSKGLRNFMQGNRASSFLAGKYVAGRDPEQVVSHTADALARHGLRASLYYLGEYVDTPELMRENVDNKLGIVRALRPTGLDMHVSVDLTQIGQDIDAETAARNARSVAEEIRAAAGGRPGFHCLMFDMEDLDYVDTTIALHNAFRAEGLPVALTLQSYLRRTEADLRAQILAGSRVRLVKGAFLGSPDVAYTRRNEIKANNRRLIELMFAEDAREAGFYPIIATHDDAIQDFALACARKSGWSQGSYEFEMLLGVRTPLARRLAESGERVRLYRPFGRDWWPYAVRRIGENPSNAILLARSLFQ